MQVVPLEVKSGKDYRIHSPLSRFVAIPDYHINKGYVLLNKGYVLSHSYEIEKKDSIIYIPVYMVMFFNAAGPETEMIPI